MSLGRTIAAVVGTVVVVALVGVPAASAHPLGNFTVNHAHTLTLRPDAVLDRAVVDYAEIPTAQAEPIIDTTGDGDVTAAERATFAVAACEAVRSALTLTSAVATSSDSTRGPLVVSFTTMLSSFTYEPGQAGLPTGRLVCELAAPVDLSAPTTLSFSDTNDSGRVGWREISAVGDGVRIVDSPVPEVSTTRELREYPVDLLDSPLEVTAVVLMTEPSGVSPRPAADAADAAEQPGDGGVVESGSSFTGGPLAGFVDRISGAFDDLVGRRDLTVGVGLLAVALSMLLGASHALLPGHGKAVMAAYIAGREGNGRDAVIVGATVTATHTGGVLLLGLALTLSSSLAGETVIAWLGAVSGLLIMSLGVSLLIAATRHRTLSHGHGHAFGGHSHADHGHAFGGHSHADHGHAFGDHSHTDHGHDHGHDHERDENPAVESSVVVGASARPATARVRVHDHRVAQVGVSVGASPEPGFGVGTGETRSCGTDLRAADHGEHHDHDHDHGPVHDHGPLHDHGNEGGRGGGWQASRSRLGLVGMGVAGGLVPSPSALVVLLSAIALGRTAFGVILVIGYGLGMAATLTLAGLLLVRLRDRHRQRATVRRGRVARLARVWTVVAPYATAALVVVVGIGLAVRSLASL